MKKCICFQVLLDQSSQWSENKKDPDPNRGEGKDYMLVAYWQMVGQKYNLPFP